MAGFDGTIPDCPATYDDIPAASYDAAERLTFMDGDGIYAEVLYPNVGGFGSAIVAASRRHGPRMSACGRTTTSSSTGRRSRPDRLLPS